MLHTPAPNFFIVGAPKCGTTSMYEYLRQHPLVFLPYDLNHYWLAKEPNFFCQELIKRSGLAISDELSYCSLFADAGDAVAIGESSALYLYSHSSAKRIQQFCSTRTNVPAKIIIMLREPVSMMQSWHADNLRHGHEDTVSFEEAIKLEEPRSSGKKIPRGCGYPDCLQYRKLATFSEQIQRFRIVFGLDQLKIILLEDMATAPQATFDTVLSFLGIPPGFVPDLTVRNERMALSSPRIGLHKLKNRLREFPGIDLMRKLLPSDIGQWAETAIKPFESRRRVNQAVNPKFLEQLRNEMAPEVAILGELLGRSLAEWSPPK